ncbi:MAG: tyrosine-type recombinase/integrase [Deltaproteobacteria bacterium]
MACKIKKVKNTKDIYEVRWDTRSPWDNHRVQHKKRIHGSKADAGRYLRQILSDIDRGINADLGKITLKDYLVKWMSSYCTEARLQYKTRKSYISIINNHIIPSLGCIKLCNLKAHHITDYYTDMLKLKEQGGAGLSSTSVRTHHQILHNALRHAVNQEYIASNPVDKVDPPKKKQVEYEILSDEQMEYLLYNCQNHPIYLFIHLALMTGMRLGEIAGLRWQDVNLETELILVRHSLQRQEGKLVLKEPKNSNSRRTIPIPTYTVNLLKEIRKELQNRPGGDGNIGIDTLFVCGGKNGMPTDPDWVSKKWPQLVAKDDRLPDLRFHDLRHTHATFLGSRGLNPTVVKERLGHSSIATTVDIYTHFMPDMQQQALGILNSRFPIPSATASPVEITNDEAVIYEQ